MRHLIKVEDSILKVIKGINSVKTVHIDSLNLRLVIEVKRRCDVCASHFKKRDVTRFSDGTYVCAFCREQADKISG